MAGRAPATARDKTSFAATCSLLSQYLKDNQGGLAMAQPAPAAESPIVAGAGAGAFRPPTTMNLLSWLDAPAEEPREKATTGEPKDHDKRTAGNPREAAGGDEAQHLTIFYGGKLVVFDKFPSTKVRDLLQIVNPGGDGVDSRAGATVPAQNLPTPSHSSLSDLPIARRNSLHRFLEKRKDRITAKAPYQVNNSSAGVEASKAEKNWLGLGQEATTVKQEL